MQVVQRAIDNHPSGLILHIDELDKATSEEQWSAVTRQEIFCLLDRRIGYTGTNTRPWLERHTRALRERVFVATSGAWHDTWRDKIGARTMSFVATRQIQNEAEDIDAAVRQSRRIPDELLNRLSPWLLLRPYTSDDFTRLAAQLGLPADFDCSRAAGSGLNFRYIESYLTERAIERELALTEAQSTRQHL